MLLFFIFGYAMFLLHFCLVRCDLTQCVYRIDSNKIQYFE